MSSRTLTVLARKEIRALAVPWLGAFSVMLLSLAGPANWRGFAVLTYVIAAAVLGALSVGHEYNDRMLGSLLSQPIARRRLFAIKQGVLFGLLLILAAAVVPALFKASRVAPPVQWAALLLPLAGGLFIAPHLTMVCRGALAGAVFTLGIPGVLLVAGGLLGMMREDFRVEDGSEFQFVFMLWGTLAQCAISAVMNWRLFGNLEAIESRGRDLQIPAWIGAAPETQGAFRKRSRTALLIGKELRLHPMAFVLAGLLVLGWLGALTLRGRYPDIIAVFYVLSAFYAALIALLVGSVASAEERQLGTIEWQALLPVAVRTQWIVKAGVALALTVVLAWGLPTLLIGLGPAPLPSHRGLGPFAQPVFGAGLLLLTACGLYASSTSASGLRALLISLPSLYAAGLFVGFLFGWVGEPIFTAVRSTTGATAAVFVHRLYQVPPLVAAVIVAAVILRCALTNYRAADHPAGRITRQLVAITASLAFGVVLVAVLSAL